MIYKIDALDIFKSYDTLVIYFKDGKWHGVTHTDQYRLLKRDKKQLIDIICKKYKVGAIDVRFVKFKTLIGEG